MSSTLQPALASRNGATLKILCIARISTVHQDERSLADQEAELRAYVKRVYDGPTEWTVIASRGSGEHLDRIELAEAVDHIESQRFDVVLAEDLARICRRRRAYDFCELCVDCGTRLIALNDHIDTADSGWEDRAFISTWHHERSNRDTSDRIRRSLRNRFVNGGVVHSVIYGYVKPSGAKSDAELQKDPDAEPIYREWFRRLDDGASYAEVADWLNEQKIPVGPACRKSRWTAQMVGQITHNPILKGLRVRNKKKSVRLNRTGRHHCVNAPPEERLERKCTHLAFFEETYYDRVVAKVDARNAKYTRVRNGRDPLRGRPRKRTRWPGQHLFCPFCGHMFVYGGHGQAHHLICEGAHSYVCWQAISVDGPSAARKLTDAIMAEIERIPDFEPDLLNRLKQETAALNSHRGSRLQDIASVLKENARQTENLVAAIRQSQNSQRLLTELSRLEEEKAALEAECRELQIATPKAITLPPIDEIKRMAREKLAGLAENAQDSARQIRILVPRIAVHPYRLCDGGHIVLRAKFRFDLLPLLQLPVGGAISTLHKDMVVDLFDPVQREAFRTRVVALNTAGMQQREIAAELGITQPAVQNALRLQREMDRLGTQDPYVPVLQPPEDYKKLRRHKHPRYHFEPSADNTES
jgi:DNA invertase Pin-like site-specific DNA recombinase